LRLILEPGLHVRGGEGSEADRPPGFGTPVAYLPDDHKVSNRCCNLASLTHFCQT
jgi:hypothetical protein